MVSASQTRLLPDGDGVDSFTGRIGTIKALAGAGFAGVASRTALDDSDEGSSVPFNADGAEGSTLALDKMTWGGLFFGLLPLYPSTYSSPREAAS